MEQFWHPGEAMEQISKHVFRIGKHVLLEIDSELEITTEDGWRSRALGEKIPSPYLRAYKRCVLPASLKTVLIY